MHSGFREVQASIERGGRTSYFTLSIGAHRVATVRTCGLLFGGIIVVHVNSYEGCLILVTGDT